MPFTVPQPAPPFGLSYESWFAACEPDLSHVPSVVRVGANHRQALIASVFMFAVLFVTPLFAACASYWIITGPRADQLSRFDRNLFIGLGIFSLVTFPVGLKSALDPWLARRWQRTITFGASAVSVADTNGRIKNSWQEPYAAYEGLVLHVVHGEIHTLSIQSITLRHPDKSRSLLLHTSQGGGLSSDIRRKMLGWSQQLGVPALVETAPNVIEPLTAAG